MVKKYGPPGDRPKPKPRPKKSKREITRISVPVIPVGPYVLIRFDDAGEDSSETGHVVSIGLGVPGEYFDIGHVDNHNARGFVLGDKVLITKPSDIYREIPPDNDDPERPMHCIVNVKDILCILPT